MTRVKPRQPNVIDVKVGEQLRLHRTIQKLSQQQLGDGVGVTFQQIQKYERGANRIGASRLWQFSQILDIPVSEFYVGCTDPAKKRTPKQSVELISLSQSSFGIKMATALNKIEDQGQRRQLLALARVMGGQSAED